VIISSGLELIEDLFRSGSTVHEHLRRERSGSREQRGNSAHDHTLVLSGGRVKRLSACELL
jgi:hypothetical protein